MNKQAKKTQSAFRRKMRVRNTIRAQRNPRPRLSIHKTSSHMYAQVIDDVKGTTLAHASTLEKALRDELKNGTGNAKGAAAVGKLIAERAKKAGIEDVAFDRGAFRYHGRVKALAEAAREGGLKF